MGPVVAHVAAFGATALRNASPLMAPATGTMLKGDELMGTLADLAACWWAGAEAAELSAAVAAAKLAAVVTVPCRA